MIYCVFVGASASISDELHKIEKGRRDVKMIAPAVKKSDVGLGERSINLAFKTAMEVFRKDDISEEKCRLVVISYPSSNISIVRRLISAFGAAAWIQFISNDNFHKASKLRNEVEVALKKVSPMLHEVSSEVFGRRKSSPLTLPLKNFSAPIVDEMKQHWYQCGSQEELQKKIQKLRAGFSARRQSGECAFMDDKGLSFAPAADGECHGLAHPAGNSDKTFIRGKFRFGVSLFSGFHYDVKDGRGRTLQSTLMDADRGARKLKTEKRKYINIHPNDVLLPRA
ncbi:hypothetical protein [Rhodovulum sulfidophilum]|uniref:hypothetical protein n=1 Tax=Rhodovulum sulfidophilum TaxID=35806 RepID=UPI00117A5F70|nr:hypothetical protein [Rhodovulum sulfidophilum]MBL3554263.1 hypothetical protein [Rhodovulum sulfidophilum]